MVDSESELVIGIDNREHKLIEIFKLNSKNKYQVENLAVGDIIYNKGKQTLLILERKTIKDLESSLKDGRYREQKQRLKDSTAIKTGYIIEGNSSVKFKSTLDSIIIGLQYRDQQLVFRTTSLEHTADLILKIKSKLNSYIKDNSISIDLNETPNPNPNPNSYIPKINKCPKDNISPDICYRMSLSQVPGISYNFADKIALVYPNFKSLQNSTIDKLAEVRISEKRKLGKVASKNIFRMFSLS